MIFKNNFKINRLNGELASPFAQINQNLSFNLATVIRLSTTEQSIYRFQFRSFLRNKIEVLPPFLISLFTAKGFPKTLHSHGCNCTQVSLKHRM